MNFDIYVNNTRMNYIGKYISSHQLVELAALPQGNDYEYSITYETLNDGTGGIMGNNDIVQVKEEMIFTIKLNE